MSEAVIRPAGDSALLVEFENEISLEVNSRVRALKYTLEQSPFDLLQPPEDPRKSGTGGGPVEAGPYG